MYFKSLEIYGFKSFGERTKLVFEPGVTAIVGPNGCGKSNITDAIRWVLGEQSAKTLRGGRMEDLIFNGTQDKEPLNMCEVTFTLDNGQRLLPIDYDEVTITRRLFRSGESSYFINKTEVRLRDIQELIAGTGLNSESYSFIAQGKIDTLLSSKPEERRSLFEEASGITKYKAKKREALRKLEQTEQNLDRVNDIVSEVARQIRSVERQAKKAEKYKESFDILKRLELKSAKIKLGVIDKEKSESSDEAETLSFQRDSLSEAIEGMETRMRQLRQSCSSLEDQITQVNSSISSIDMEMTTARNKIVLNGDRIRELNERSESINRQTEIAVRKIDELENNLVELREQKNNLELALSDKENLLVEKEQTLKAIIECLHSNIASIDENKARLLDISSQESSVRNLLTKNTADLQSSSTRARRLNVEENKTRDMMESLSVSLHEAEEKVSQQKAKVGEISSRRNGIKSEILALNQRIEIIASELENHKAELSSKKSRLAVLIEAQKSYEGFSRGPKAVLKLKDVLSGSVEREDGLTYPELAPEKICGAISSLIGVRDGLESVVEIALGELAQSIVVEDDYTVEVLIRFLKDNNLGRVHLLSLQKVAEYLQLNQDIGLPIERLSEVITYQERFSSVFNSLFSRFLYTTDNIITKTVPNGFVLFSGEGVVIRNSVVSGGSINKGDITGLIGREKKIQQLEKDISALQIKTEQMAGEYAQSKERVAGLNQSLEGLEAELKAAEIDLAGSQSVFDNVNSEYERLKEELSLIELELSEVNENIELFKQREVEYTEKLQALKDENNAVTVSIEDSEKAIKEKTHEKESFLIEIEQIRGEVAAVKEKFEIGNKEYMRISKELDDAKVRLNENNTELDYISEKTGQLKEENVACSAKVDQLESEKTSKVSELSHLRESKDKAYKEAEEFEINVTDEREKFNLVSSRLSDLNVRSTELGYQRSSIYNRIQEIYHIDMDQEEVEIESDIDIPQLETDLAEIRQKVERMGAVNLVAIEEHKELEERFEFLTTQREDLLRAKDDLMKAIDKINKTTKQLFLETFDKIHVEFQKYFKLLFNGGAARLILLDSEDVLESGIEIEARPPGKALQSISLMSGGEKALSAVSLLFAIFKVKPSPFCVLDEIDAPLDEANIDRFLLLLKEFLKTSQFIIVTHNKKTITISDVMYGITMQSSGVSKIVSVKFADDKKKEVSTTKTEVDNESVSEPAK